MAKELIKGNEAVIKGALLAGCRNYFGYPITPASEIAHAASKYFPLLGRSFLQGESEVASINMCYGAASAGVRTMTASSGPGISLKQEGISYAAGSELPIVIVDIQRGGPGLGNIAPEQGDYNQVTKGGGHGNYKTIVLAPNCAQEMCDLTMLAFDLADEYRTPVYVFTDGYIGQMMEPVEFPKAREIKVEKDWAVWGNRESRDNLINSIYLEPLELEAHNQKLQDKYQLIEEKEVMFDTYRLDDAELVTMGYGIVSRILKTAIDKARKKGLKVGLLRPITLFPFPNKKIQELGNRVNSFLVVEMSNGQMVQDVKLALLGAKPVYFYNRMGGVVPTVNEVLNKIEEILK
ncbi:3-methyl-2-oxobutanoate dehydrogenase subunit VorB [bacterium]|nr:3-methyl-2-oxobutanoate dehydrogenase subunit VorB [bacterium]